MGLEGNGEHWEQGVFQTSCFIVLRVTGSTETARSLKESDRKAQQIVTGLQQVWRTPEKKTPMAYIC